MSRGELYIRIWCNPDTTPRKEGESGVEHSGGNAHYIRHMNRIKVQNLIKIIYKYGWMCWFVWYR